MTIMDVLNGKQEWHIETSDCLDVLRTMPDASVQCCVTSPPYWGLRDYGVDGQLGLEETPEEYVDNMVGVFREVQRVLRDDGTLWLNLGDSYAASGKGEGGSFDGKRPGWAHVPGKRMERGSGRWGGGNRPATEGLKPKDLVGIPWRVAFALQADGWYLRSDIIWEKPNPMPESVTDRPTRAHEYIFLLSKSRRYYYDADAIREESVGQTDHDVTGWGYSAPGQVPQTGNRKYSFARKVNETAPPGQSLQHRPEREDIAYCHSRNKRDVWTVATSPFPGAHFATFPPALIEPCVLAGCPEGGIVLDPFSGAGTTGLVALRHGRKYVGIELNPEYVAMSERRIIADAPLLNGI